jgi:F0F1-type ATP synthase assembly protein I
VLALDVLAENNFGDTRSGSLAGPLGLLILLLLGIGTVFLIRNMNARLRRLPPSFDPPPSASSASEPDRGDSTSTGSTTDAR